MLYPVPPSIIPRMPKRDCGTHGTIKDRIYRGRMSLGGSVSDHGYLYPDTEFFMEFSWAVENGRWHCISITPKWPNMHIFLDADGNIDMNKVSGTNVGKLKECQWDLVKP